MRRLWFLLPVLVLLWIGTAMTAAQTTPPTPTRSGSQGVAALLTQLAASTRDAAATASAVVPAASPTTVNAGIVASPTLAATRTPQATPTPPSAFQTLIAQNTNAARLTPTTTPTPSQTITATLGGLTTPVPGATIQPATGANGLATLSPALLPTIDPAFVSTLIPSLPPPIIGEATLAPEAEATEDLGALVGDDQAEAIPALIEARADLERIADDLLGGVRPDGWSGGGDALDPQVAILTRIDLELLATVVYGTERPDAWFGVVVSKPLGVARDIRHDLEVLADALYGEGVRPENWIGSPDPLITCNRATQSLVAALRISFLYDPAIAIDPTDPDFCDRVEDTASVWVDTNLVQPGIDLPPPPTPIIPVFDAPNQIASQFAIGFFDRAAQQRGGVIPDGTRFEIAGRSDTDFSNMMLIEGADFRLFVDYTFTSVTTAQFETLANVESANEQTRCEADWCGS